MRKLLQNDALTHLEYCQLHKKEDTFFGIWEDTIVHYGWDSQFDRELARQKGIRCINLGRAGDTFVTQKGDIAYAHLTTSADKFNQHLGKFLAQKLTALGYDVKFDGNDWLIDGKKFMGTMRIELGPVFHFYGGHISLSTDNELIKQICQKPMQKEPVGLSEYGITTQQVEDWLHEFYFYWKK